MIKGKQTFFIVLVLVLMAGLAVGCSKANNRGDQPAVASGGTDSEQGKALEKIRARGKLIVGVKTDYEPFGYINEKGENAGFEIEMARADKIDLVIAAMSVTEERAKEVDFSEPYFKSGVQLLVPKDSPIQAVADLKGKKVIVAPGRTADIGISQQVPDAELIKLQKTSESVQALRDGRADAYAQDNTLLYPIAAQNPEFKVVGTPFAELPWAIAVKKGNTDLVEWINRNLNEWEQEDRFYQWYEQWIADLMPADFNPDHFLRRPNNNLY